MELEQDQAMSEMSLAINSRFNTSGFSEYARKFGYSADALSEVMSNTARNNTYNKVVGSIAEGTDLLFSDVDILMIDQCSTVGYIPQEETNSKKVYLLLTSGPSTRKGYTQLQIYHNGKPKQIDDNLPYQYCDNHCVHVNKGQIFLTNISMLSFKLPSSDKPVYTENNGPAATLIFSEFSCDSVPAYESQIKPKAMMSWFERNRRYNWPTKETCDLFKSMGCCYVGVGHLKSQEKHLEWRISPTRQELYLMLNLNPTQFRCYIALKLIKKLFVEKVCEDMLSSYHCKTALFYTIENTDPGIWQPHNLTKCVLNCMTILLKWVNKRNCPNYFIPEENMFETKLIENSEIEKLQMILDTLICNCLGTCFKLLNYMDRNFFKSEKLHIRGRALNLKTKLKNVNITHCSVSEQRNKIIAIYDNVKRRTEQNDLEKIKMLRPYEPDYDLLVEVLEKRLLHLKRFKHLRYAMRRSIKVNKYLDIHKDITESLPEDFQYFLKLASIASAQKDYVFSDEILQNIRNIAYKSIVICRCDLTYLCKDTTTWTKNKPFAFLEKKLASAGKNINSMSIIDILQQFTMCLNFIESELEGGIVISPLHLEAYKTVGKSQRKQILSERNAAVENLMSIHSITYMYFLQYKNSQKMGKNCDMCVAVEKLEHMNLVSLREGIYSHPDSILNLLGHIYITKGWYRIAIPCFRRSLQLFQVYNAATWHIMFFMFGSTKTS